VSNSVSYLFRGALGRFSGIEVSGFRSLLIPQRNKQVLEIEFFSSHSLFNQFYL